MLNNTLVDASNVDWKIVKFFKVESNTTTVLTLVDDNSELIDGDYDYYFDFILCRVKPQNFNYNQYLFDYAKDTTKTGYLITFEEIE